MSETAGKSSGWFRLYQIAVWRFDFGIKGKQTKPDAGKSVDKFPFDKFRKIAGKKVPSAIEIAKLAAILAAGRPVNRQTSRMFAVQAVELLDGCKIERARKIDFLAMELRGQAITAHMGARPKPEKFPAKLDEVLLLLMPKKRPEDRIKIYRAYLIATIARRNVVTGIVSETSADQEVAGVSVIAATVCQVFSRALTYSGGIFYRRF